MAESTQKCDQTDTEGNGPYFYKLFTIDLHYRVFARDSCTFMRSFFVDTAGAVFLYCLAVVVSNEKSGLDV